MFLILALFVCVNSISFYVQEGQEKCFSDEIPSRSVVIVYHEYLAPKDAENNQKGKLLTQGVEFRVYDPLEVLYQRQDVKPGPNKFSFTSTSMGRYRFCVYKAKSYWESQEFKYKLKIQQGTDFSLENAANKTHVMDLQDRIDGLITRTQEFLNLQQLNRDQEDKLTTQSILINQRVFQTTLAQIFVLILSGAYQIYSLRKFFKERFLL